MLTCETPSPQDWGTQQGSWQAGGNSTFSHSGNRIRVQGRQGEEDDSGRAPNAVSWVASDLLVAPPRPPIQIQLLPRFFTPALREQDSQVNWLKTVGSVSQRSSELWEPKPTSGRGQGSGKASWRKKHLIRELLLHERTWVLTSLRKNRNAWHFPAGLFPIQGWNSYSS